METLELTSKKPISISNGKIEDVLILSTQGIASPFLRIAWCLRYPSCFKPCLLFWGEKVILIKLGLFHF